MDNNNGIFPNSFLTHDHLRRGGSCNPGGRVKANIRFAYSTKTDVFELYLRDPATEQFLVASRHDEELKARNQTIATTMAVALRDALATILGINSDEMGFAVKQTKIEQGGQPIFGICIFDTNGGGSGFASSAPLHIEDMFRKAEQQFNCTCSNACEKCLISFDTKNIAENLNRNKALEFLRNGFIDGLRLSEDLKFFGDSSKFCFEDIFKEIEANKNNHRKSLDLFFYGKRENWDFSIASLRYRIIHQWGNHFNEIKLYFEKGSLSELESDEKELIYRLFEDKVNVFEIEKINRLAHGGILLARINSTDSSIIFGTNNVQQGYLGKDWGKKEGSPLISCENWPLEISQSQEFQRTDFLPSDENNNARLIEFSDDLNGSLSGFGKRFWDFISKNSPDKLECLKSGISKITYTDRFLKTPLTVSLLAEVINNLPEGPVNVNLDISTEYLVGENKYDTMFFDSNWDEKWNDDRLEFVQSIIDESFNFNLRELEKEDLPHWRKLTIFTRSGINLEIRFDQGVGFWEVARKKYGFFPYEGLVEWYQKKRQSILLETKPYQWSFVVVSNKN
jgi:hypothetical protein